MTGREEQMPHERILVGLDGSKGSFKALREAVHIADLCGAELHAITVEEIPRYPGTMDEVIEAKETADERFQDALRKARKTAENSGIELHTTLIVGHEVKSIVEFVKNGRFDLLVIGFMGHSALCDRVMGSTCQALVRLVPCSVLVVK
jgi:nucleotide-binding universal stress UspA family protein